MLKFGPLLGGGHKTSTRASCVTHKLYSLTHTSQVSLEISPRICLYDVPSRITVKGLEPRAPVTLKSSLLAGPRQKEFVSHAYYWTDDKGEVNVSRDASVGGSYEGVFPMGLLTTLKPAPGVNEFLRCLKKNASTPETVHVSLYKDHLPIEEHFAENKCSRPEAVASCEMERHAMAPGVRRIPVRQDRLRGTLFLPPGPGPFPGVVDTYGGVPGLVEIRAALLASRGIAAFALATFSFEDLPKSYERVELEYYEEAINYLLGQPNVIPDRCGLVSVSQTAFPSLLCGAWMDRVKAVVSICGYTYFHDCHLTYKNTEYFGDPYGVDDMVIKDGQMTSLSAKYLSILEKKLDPEYSHAIPVEEADEDTYFLAFAGDEDILQLHKGLKALQKYMSARGRSDKIKTILYPGVGHILEVPYTPNCQKLWQFFPSDLIQVSGLSGVSVHYGSKHPYQYGLAQTQHWHEIQSFILQHIRDESPWYQNYTNGQRV